MHVLNALPSVASALGHARKRTTDLEDLIEGGEDGAGAAGAEFVYRGSKRHHHQRTFTSNELVGDRVVGRRVRISIKLLIDIRLRFGGFDGRDDMYGPLRTPFRRIHCELCPSAGVSRVYIRVWLYLQVATACVT